MKYRLSLTGLFKSFDKNHTFLSIYPENNKNFWLQIFVTKFFQNLKKRGRER